MADIKMTDVAALNTATATPEEAPEEAPEERVFISAGMDSDLQVQGWCVNPMTGDRIEQNEDGTRTITSRATGKTRDL